MDISLRANGLRRRVIRIVASVGDRMETNELVVFVKAWHDRGFFYAARVLRQAFYDNLFLGGDVLVYLLNLLFEFVIIALIVVVMFAVITGVLLAGAALIDAVIFLCKSSHRRDNRRERA
jgi:hypothetical protein